MTKEPNVISIFRYEIPVDDREHTVRLRGRILHVAARRPDVVEIWAEHEHNTFAEQPRRFRVYGTGHPDVQGEHVGTALAADGQLVWHLRELTR